MTMDNSDYKAWLAMGREMLSKWELRLKSIEAERAAMRARDEQLGRESDELRSAIDQARGKSTADDQPEGWKRVAMERNRRVIGVANGALTIEQIANAIGCTPTEAGAALARAARLGQLVRVRPAVYAQLPLRVAK